LVCQITVIKLEGYGAWTLTLGNDREHALQILQSKMYAELQECFSAKNGLVFSNRFDEFIAVTNQISLHDHKEIHDRLSKRNESLKISMTIGTGKTPLEADKAIHNIKKDTKNMIFPNIYGIQENCYVRKDQQINELENNSGHNDLKILHIDVNGSASIAENRSTYEITNLIMRLYLAISNSFLKEESLTFFLGGDNFMVVAKNDIQLKKVTEIVNFLMSSTGIKLNCGIGNSNNARRAAEKATKSLDSIRDYRRSGKIINVFESN
jgi:GTP cyclohydrolase IIa